MNNRCLKLLITLGLVLCVLFSSAVLCFAETEESPENTEPTIAETEDTTSSDIVVTPVKPSVTIVPDTTEAIEVRPDTTAQTVVPSTTQRVPRPTVQATREYINTPDRNDNNNDRDEVQQSTTTTKSDTTLPELPEGSFYVFLELNNGKPRLKRVMDKEGRVPAPNIPEREGYVFDGWYADPKFTKPWDFDTSVAKDTVVIYAKWIADDSTVTYKITVDKLAGGSIEVNPATASRGEPVIITVNPDKGMRMVDGSLTINGKRSDVLSFVMPASNVTISAKFEKIPVEANEDNEKVSIKPFIIGAAIIIVAIIVITIIIVKRRADYQVPEFDESGALIIDDEDADSWLDESIVIEDGFENGKIVRENVIPDYGDPDEEDY